MKRFLVLFTVLFLFLGVQAQKGLKFGLFAIPQNTWLLNPEDFVKPLNEYQHRVTMGMAGGVSFGYNFIDMLGVRVNVVFSHQGQNYNSLNSLNKEVNHSIRLNYFKFPLMIHFNTKTEYAKVIPHIAAGFQLNLLSGAKYNDNNTIFEAPPDFSEEIFNYPPFRDRYFVMDFGPVVEFGVDIKLTYMLMANILIRADYGLGDAEDKNVTYWLDENGTPHKEFFWDQLRPKTQNITAGLFFGITYTLNTQ